MCLFPRPLPPLLPEISAENSASAFLSFNPFHHLVQTLAFLTSASIQKLPKSRFSFHKKSPLDILAHQLLPNTLQ